MISCFIISKFLIVPFVMYICEAKPTLPTNFEETTWEKLQTAIRAIFLKKPVSFDLEGLYQVTLLVNSAAFFIRCFLSYVENVLLDEKMSGC